MVYHQGKIALISFFAAVFLLSLNESFITIFLKNKQGYYSYWTLLLNYGLSCLCAKFICSASNYQISIRASFLGYTFGSGLLFYLAMPQSWKIFGAYIAILSVFHMTEFLAIAFTNPSALSVDTFIINHSTAYTLAAGCSWIEFLVERYYFPEMKTNLWIPLVGLILCGIGELLRKTAIFTAKRNFNHIVQSKKASNHTLVTHGVYNICRHPSYVGWFYWSVGTQLILQNPLCSVLYAITSWKFFHDRIFIEEISLLNFFGNDYVQYQKKVGTGLPFISGYKI